MKLTISLFDQCSRHTVGTIARTYALLCIHSTLPAECVNAPWGGHRSAGKNWQATYREWMAEVDRERAAYRKTLESILPELPAAPVIEWKEYRSPATGRTYKATYAAQTAHAAARDFAAAVLAKLDL